MNRAEMLRLGIGAAEPGLEHDPTALRGTPQLLTQPLILEAMIAGEEDPQGPGRPGPQGRFRPQAQAARRGGART